MLAGGLPPNTDENVLLTTFSVFGDVIEVQIPREGGPQAIDRMSSFSPSYHHSMLKARHADNALTLTGPHRGFGFVVFSTSEEAEDAIDNMHLNEIDGVSTSLPFLPFAFCPELLQDANVIAIWPHQKIINVNLAKPLKAMIGGNKPVWQDEEWIKQYATPAEGAAVAGETAEVGE